VYVNGNVIVPRDEEIASSAVALPQIIRWPTANSDFCHQVALEMRGSAMGKIPTGAPFRSAALSREESVVSPLAASRFLADRAGFGMTREIVFSQNTARPKPD
jgi:hypothetical protein